MDLRSRLVELASEHNADAAEICRVLKCSGTLIYNGHECGVVLDWEAGGTRLSAESLNHLAGEFIALANALELVSSGLPPIEQQFTADDIQAMLAALDQYRKGRQVCAEACLSENLGRHLAEIEPLAIPLDFIWRLRSPLLPPDGSTGDA